MGLPVSEKPLKFRLELDYNSCRRVKISESYVNRCVDKSAFSLTNDKQLFKENLKLRLGNIGFEEFPEIGRGSKKMRLMKTKMY